MPTVIYWLIVASLHSTDNHGYSLFHSKAVIDKESAPTAFCSVIQYLTEIMPTIIFWLTVVSLHSRDNHGYSLFHIKAVIRKESAPKACCGVRGRQLRPWLLCLPIFNSDIANNHLLAYSRHPPLHGQSWVQFIPQ